MKYYSIYTKEEILNRFNEEDLLNLYGFKLGLSNSPFRRDNNPSFKLFESYNKVYYKDFSTGEAGDLFSFLMKLTSKNFSEILKDISYKLISNNSINFNSTTYTKKDIESTTDIICKVKKYSSYELRYWMQYYIYEEDLNKNNIYSINEATIITGNYKYTLFSTIDNPIFGYSWFDKKSNKIKWKLYRPLEEKVKKWRNNISKNAIFWFIINSDDSTLIVTKSIKDALVLNNLGYNALVSASETIVFEKEFIDKLISRFNVILLYDFDYAGVSTCNRIRKLNPNLNKKYLFLQNFKNRHNKLKDISDNIKELGYLSSKNLLDGKCYNM